MTTVSEAKWTLGTVVRDTAFFLSPRNGEEHASAKNRSSLACASAGRLLLSTGSRTSQRDAETHCQPGTSLGSGPADGQLPLQALEHKRPDLCEVAHRACRRLGNLHLLFSSPKPQASACCL